MARVRRKRYKRRLELGRCAVVEQAPLANYLDNFVPVMLGMR